MKKFLARSLNPQSNSLLLRSVAPTRTKEMRLVHLHDPLDHLPLAFRRKKIGIEWRVNCEYMGSPKKLRNLWLVVYSAVAKVDRHDFFAVGHRVHMHVRSTQLEIPSHPGLICFVQCVQIPGFQRRCTINHVRQRNIYIF